MNLSMQLDELSEYYSFQLNNIFPDRFKIRPSDLKKTIDISLDRLDYCFKRVAFKRYFNDSQTIYNHLYSDHNVVFIWFLANTAFKVYENSNLSSKLYYLNKTLHSFDCMYDTELPDIFLIFHGSGTMLGKAKYNDYFVCLQGCTVGSHKGDYPIFGKGVALAADSGVIGNCVIGNGVSISAFTKIFNKNIPDGSVVFTNENGKVEIKPSKNMYAQQFFNVSCLG
jgi:serine O-acetyltransferase